MESNGNKSFSSKKSNKISVSSREKKSISSQKSYKKSESSLSSKYIYITNEQNIENLKNNLYSIQNLQYNTQTNIFDNINNYIRNSNELFDFFKENNFFKNKIEMDDFIFEEKIINLLETKFELKALDAFPLFEVKNSKNGTKITSLNIFKITLLDKKLYFLSNLNSLCFSNDDTIFIINIENMIPKNLTIISNNLKKFEKKFILEKNIYYTNFYQGEIKDINFSLENCLKKKNNNYIDLKNLLNNNNINDKEKVEKAKNYIQKIDENDSFLNKINVSFEKINLELDGFFITTKNITIKLENKQIIIPKNFYIIIEIKNNNNLMKLKKNIHKKKNIFNCFGFDITKAYFIGVLNSKPEEEQLNNEKDINDNRVIFLYPDLLNISNDEIYYRINHNITIKEEFQEIKNEIKELKNQLNEQNNNFQTKFEELKKLIQNK